MTDRGRIGRAAAALATVLFAGTMAACTGVPSSSSPQTVQPIGLGEPAVPSVAPRPNASPREIVDDFLQANSTDPVKHAAAREFLTSSARNRWSDLTATIVSDLRVGTYDAQSHIVPVSGRVVGYLDSQGVYKPSLNGTGHGGTVVPYTFGLSQANGQYRINTLRNGLLMTEDQFSTSYQQRVLYFYDNAERYLVPDVRYSALTDAVELADWLLGQLVSGPNSTLQNVVSTDTLPVQARRISAKITSSLTTVQIPGSGQLGPDVRNRLAAQVSVTLKKAVNVDDITIDDGATPVVVPRASGTRFSESDFRDAEGPPAPAQDVYYLDLAGHIRRQSGALLRGPLNTGRVAFDSVALAQPAAIGALTVAAVQGTGDQQRLVVGTAEYGVRPTSVSGRLTRPAWVPGRAEVWIGQGAKVIRVVTDGRTSAATAVSIPSAAGGGRVVALRLSPDGSRVALVIAGANGLPQLYVGPVARSGKTVEVDGLQQVSPDGVVIDDVAWVDPLKLYAIGYLRGSLDAGVFESAIDGSQWDDLGISTLPKPPTSITATTDAPAWVSADGFVWQQNGSNWVSPGAEPNGQTPGEKPVYLG